HVKIYSEIGHGTSFRLYFPKAARQAGSETEIQGHVKGEVASGRETVLVVEDDPAVRKAAVRTLEGLGYQVRQAVDGKSGLAVLHGPSHVDLLFTDMIMPNGISGQDLANAARQL